MKSGDLRSAVRRFLERRIDGIEQLEILVLLQHHADRSWTGAGVADALRLVPRVAAHHLEALGRRDLLDVRLGDDDLLYKFDPATPELADAVRQVVEAYRDRRTAVVEFVATRRRRSLQDFSDAFRLSVEDEDG